ncbi:adenylate kinase [Peredibacter sp. HCB2-198]|uniref:adenylate kinase n=1 Tax=Peredibacter sp. HCB2-198 TaxID=3383025 RepID=UPI0038B4BEF9
MKKIIVVGTTASGKSTLARKISQILDIPHVQLDVLFWGPNWTESSDELFFAKIQTAVQGDSWVVDGNYSRGNHLTWPHADTVIWIDLPFWLNFYQSSSRAFIRALTKEELWPGTGNYETFRMLFSKDSILLWFFKTYKSNRKKYLQIMGDPKHGHIKFIHLRSRSEIEKLIGDLQRNF